jgi:hypothetical protein
MRTELSIETLIAQEYGAVEEAHSPALMRFAEDTSNDLALRARAAVHAYYGMREHGSFDDLISIMERLYQSAAQLPEELAISLGISLISVLSEVGLLNRSRALTKELLARDLKPRKRFQLLYYAFYDHRRAKELDEAKRYLDAMNALDYEQLAPLSLCYYQACVATLAESMGHYERGRDAYTLAIYTARSQQALIPGSIKIIHSNQLELARLMVHGGEFEQAALICEDVLEQLGDSPALHIASSAYLYHGLATLGAGQPRAAHSALQRSAQIAEQLPLPRIAAHAHLYLAWQAFVDARPDLMSAHLRSCARHDSMGERYCASWLPPMQRLLAAYDTTMEPAVSASEGPSAILDQLREAWLLGHPAAAPIPALTITEPLARVAYAHLHDRRARLTLNERGDTLRVDDQIVDLGKRGPLRRIFLALCEARRSEQPWRSTVALFEAGWPDIEEVPANGFRRVYTELHRLKEWGVAITSGELGYRLDELPVSAREIV